MAESGFYNASNGKLIYAPNFVYHKDYELTREAKTQEKLIDKPVDGWTWVETRKEALTLFGIDEKDDSPVLCDRCRKVLARVW